MVAEQVQAIHSLIDDLQQAADMMIHAQNIDYQVPSIDPGEQEYSTDSWDAGDAEASYPNPSDEDTDLGAFRKNYLLAPPMDSDQAETKSAYKLPIRNSHQGAVNVNSLQAVQQAINGARGGVEGVSEDTLQSAYSKATQMRVASNDIEESGEAPDFEARSANIQASIPFTDEIEADAGSTEAGADGLAGIVWASGTHNLWLNGDPTKVHVPEDTISDTFQRLKERLEAESVKIGFDHPNDDSVAAKTPLGEIGKAKEFTQDSLPDGREAITMRESEFTNSKAVEAAEAGSFEDFGFSIVGNIGLATTEEGQPKKRDDGSLILQATEIQRIDVVPDQAVEGAKNGNLPELAAAAEAAGRLAASSPNQATDGFVQTLRAAAGGAEANNHNMTDSDDFPTDPEDLEAAQAALSQAGDVVEAKEEQIEELEAEVSDLEDQAKHFRQIAASQGVDPDEDDFEAQAVIDAFTEDLRAEIADLEAALPKYDTEDQEDRSEELAGKSISELEAMAGERWREFGRSKAKRDELSAAVTAEESVGGVSSGGSGGSQEDADEAAKGALRARELQEANDAGQSPSEYVEAEYGVEATEYESERELQAAIKEGEA